MEKDWKQDTYQYVEKLNPEMVRYMDCMTDIKQRWMQIQNVIRSNSYKPNKRNIESNCLQFRMIVELIFLANLSSHEGYYFKTLSELANMWHIEEIISNINKVNSNYYPEVIKLDKKNVPGRPDANGHIYFLPNPLSKDDLVKMYTQCCEYLHPLNPFAKEKDYRVHEKFRLWSDKLKGLLSSHAIQLVEQKLKIFCIIDFENKSVGKTDIQVGFTNRVL